MSVKCKYCRSKYRLTRTAYDDMEYLGRHIIACKNCNRSFAVVFNGFRPIAVKC